MCLFCTPFVSCAFPFVTVGSHQVVSFFSCRSQSSFPSRCLVTCASRLDCRVLSFLVGDSWRLSLLGLGLLPPDLGGLSFSHLTLVVFFEFLTVVVLLIWLVLCHLLLFASPQAYIQLLDAFSLPCFLVIVSCLLALCPLLGPALLVRVSHRQGSSGRC